MLRVLTIGILLSLRLNAAAQDEFYKAVPFTAENLFTGNIEGPNFGRNGKLYVVNFEKDGTIACIPPDGKPQLFVTLPEGSIANAIQFDDKGDMLLADFKAHNILRVNMKTKAVSVFVHNDKFNQPNDICITDKGQLFASDPNWKEKTGQLWRIDKDGTTTLVQSDMGTTNGVELSPDQKTLYVNESIQRKIWAFSIDENGNLSNKRLHYEFEDFGMDGMKCDSKGNLFVCRYGKGTVAVISPEKQFVREVILKGKKVSNITFGGKDGKTCYVTLQDLKGMEKFRSETAGRK